MSGTIYLFQNSTADGASDPKVLSFPDDKVLIQAFGTWGGATLTLQTIAPDNSTWISINDLTGSAVTLTADTQYTVKDYVLNQQIRAVQSGSSGTTNLNLSIQGL